MNPRSNSISVIIPTYNRAEMLREALESVFSQTHPVSEIIVVDDGSTDQTDKMLAEFGGRIRTIRIAQSGISVARNTGIDAANGEFIAFLDNDDLWLPEKIEKHLDFATQHPGLVLTYTDAAQFNTDGIDKRSFTDRFPALNDPSHLLTPMIMECAVPLMSTIMIRSSFLKESGLRFQNYSGIDDLGLFLEMMMSGVEFGYLPERLTMRRMHGNNFSSNYHRRFEQRKRLYADLLERPPAGRTPAQQAALAAGLQDARYRVGECLWEALDLKHARKEFIGTLSLNGRGNEIRRLRTADTASCRCHRRHSPREGA